MATKVTSHVIADNAVTDAKLHSDFTATTQSASDNSTSVATTAYVTTAIANLSDSAPSTLNTLNELAAALGDDANYATTTTNAIAAKLPLAGGTMTGSLLIDSSSSASIGLDRGNDTSGSTVDFKTGGTLKWYMGLRGLSNDNFYLRNEAGSTDALTILTNGKVGIGTTSPSTKLTVKNDSNNTSFGDNNIITIQNASTTDNSRMGLAFTGNTTVGSGLAVIDAVSYDQSHGKTSLNFSVYSGSWHNDMMVLKEGKVGIGATSPSTTLHVTSPAGSNKSAIITRTSGAEAVNLSEMQDYNAFQILNKSSGSYLNFAGNASNTQIQAQSDGSTAEDIALNPYGGNVGIGVISPLGKLHIRDGSAQSGISHTYIYDGSAISVEANEPAIQLMAEDSGTHGGSLLWRYGNNAFSAIANPTTDTLDFTYGVTTGNDFQAHSGHNLSSYKKMMSIHNDGIITAPYQPAFCVYNPGGTYPTAGGSKAFGKNDGTDGNYSTHVNAGSHFSTTTGRFTAPVAGNYYFSFSAMFDSSGNAGFDFEVNDVAQNGGEGLDSDNSTYTQVAGSILLALSVNDYVTLTLRGRRVHQRYGSFEGFLVG